MEMAMSMLLLNWAYPEIEIFPTIISHGSGGKDLTITEVCDQARLCWYDRSCSHCWSVYRNGMVHIAFLL